MTCMNKDLLDSFKSNKLIIRSIRIIKKIRTIRIIRTIKINLSSSRKLILNKTKRINITLKLVKHKKN